MKINEIFEAVRALSYGAYITKFDGANAFRNILIAYS